jgi:hypothetical protein
VLGVPTVADRVAQTVVKLWLEPQLDPLVDLHFNVGLGVFEPIFGTSIETFAG